VWEEGPESRNGGKDVKVKMSVCTPRRHATDQFLSHITSVLNEGANSGRFTPGRGTGAL